MPNSTADIIPTEDFWSRRANAQTESFELAPFGIPAIITANRPEPLAAARLSAGRFSRSQDVSGPPLSIQIIVRPGAEAAPPPDLPDRLIYAGTGDWLTLSAGSWGQGFANLQTRMALMVLSPGLAANARLVSRYFIDHYLLNFILSDWAMLHASCVLDAGRERLFVMIAPHNVGKSTTALRLLRAGYTFLADGMALLRQDRTGFSVGGYPTGEVKLRDDVLAQFPDYSGRRLRVREHCKTVVNLRAIHPDQLVEQLIRPASIQLCFVERAKTAQTRLTPLSPAQVLPMLAANTVYWDEASRLAHNSTALQALLRAARLHRLQIGTDGEGIVAAFDSLG